MRYGGQHREKNVQNREKTFRIEKKILEYRNIFHGQKKKKMKSRKKIKIEKNISESRKIFNRIEKTISKLRKIFKDQKLFSDKSRENILNFMTSHPIYVPS